MALVVIMVISVCVAAMFAAYLLANLLLPALSLVPA
jgi:hypothetical protein